MTTQYINPLAALARFLSPQVWKQVHQQHPTKKFNRWNLHALVMVLLAMTWGTGDSEVERFETARAFYVATHQHSKRPGRSLQGFHQALAKLPLAALHALFAAVRGALHQVFARAWRTDGFVVLAVDGSWLECPRSAELEQRLGCAGKKGSAPTLLISALVLLPAGLLWSWAVGPGQASEYDLLRQMLDRLPRNPLLVADAFYQGYALYQDILQAKASFLVRLSSRSHLYTESRTPLRRLVQGRVWFWPEPAQKAHQPPLLLRLIRVRGAKRRDVWLLTNVLQERRLSRRRAAEIYRWRWQIEGVFRTYKRTLPKVKLLARTEALVYREAEVSLLGLQLLLVQEASPRRRAEGRVIETGSPRVALLQMRGWITLTLGRQLGPRQQWAYRQRLARVQTGTRGKKVRKKWPRRKDHKPPKPPRIHRLSKRLKAKILKRLAAA